MAATQSDGELVTCRNAEAKSLTTIKYTQLDVIPTHFRHLHVSLVNVLKHEVTAFLNVPKQLKNVSWKACSMCRPSKISRAVKLRTAVGITMKSKIKAPTDLVSETWTNSCATEPTMTISYTKRKDDMQFHEYPSINPKLPRSASYPFIDTTGKSKLNIFPVHPSAPLFHTRLELVRKRDSVVHYPALTADSRNLLGYPTFRHHPINWNFLCNART